MADVAVLLSGGLDSAVLVARAARSAVVQPVYVGAGLAWEAEELALVSSLLASPAYASGVLPLARILVDAARSRQRQKRGADAPVISLDDTPTLSESRAAEFIALDDALRDLAKLDERRSRVVEMRYFGGLSVEETATVLKVSAETVMRDWKAAKAWLYTQLNRTEN